MKNKKIIAFILILILILLLITMIYIFKQKNKKNTIIESVNNNTVVEKISEYNNPTIPVNFKKVQTPSASWDIENGIPIGWNNGLVIEDEIGNQFVWIPYDSSYQTSLEKIRTYSQDELEVKNQIIKYGGFYIARFESGIPIELQNQTSDFYTDTLDFTGVPLSKKNIIPWNYISKENAKKSSEKMYENNDYVKSTLPTLKQREIVDCWLQKCGYNLKDPKEYGNYSNVNFKFTGLYSDDIGKTYKYGENKMKSEYNMILATGISDRNIANNLYDFFGNVAESTLNYGYDGYASYACGGYYDNSSITDTYTHAWPNSKIGFRVVLKLLN